MMGQDDALNLPPDPPTTTIVIVEFLHAPTRMDGFLSELFGTVTALIWKGGNASAASSLGSSKSIC